MIGYLSFVDNGHEDYKLISVVAVDPRYNDVNTLSDLSQFTLDEIKNFFQNYKELQNIEVKVYDYHDKQSALELISECQERYKESRH